MTSTVLTEYQAAFANRVEAKHAFGFWKGRAALYAILKAMGIGDGDEVIMPGYTCVMAVNPVMYVGARPVFIDIEAKTYNIDVDRIEASITPRTKLVIAQHTYGYLADLDAIMDICNRHGLPFIEDCCLALGSAYRGKLAGTYGLASYFSFQWNKPYTSGLGGMAVTSDEKLAEGIRRVSEAELVTPTARRVAMLTGQLAIYRSLIYPSTTTLAQNCFRWLVRKGLLVGSMTDAELAPEQADDFFMGMSDVQARSGHRQLRKWDQIVEHRRRMQVVYDRLLAERDWPVVQPPPHTSPVLVRYPVRVADKKRALDTAAARFVELGSWFEVPLHPENTKMEAYGYRDGDCPVAEKACREVVNLPVHPRTSDRTARRSVDFITGIGPAT